MISVTVEGDRVLVVAPFSHRLICKALPSSRWDAERRVWTVPATATHARNVHAAFQAEGFGMDAAFGQLLIEAAQIEDAQDLKHATDLPDLPGKTAAWLHQRRAYHFAKHLDGVMLAMDMGTGKSRTAIGLCEDWDGFTAQRVLILAPRNVVDVWPKQFALHADRAWDVYAAPAKATVAKRAQAAHRAMEASRMTGRPFALIVNYEAAWRTDMEILLKSVAWDVVILDESHRVKAAGGKASRFTTLLRERSTKRLCLTGTPMPHSPLDIYAQYRFLDPAIFGTSKNRFQLRYAVMGGFEGRQVIGWQNADEMTGKIGSIAFFVSKSEALPDLPPFVHVERRFDLGPKSLRAYVQLERDFVAGVEEGLVVANNALTKLLRLRQVTGGFTVTEDDQVVELGDERERLLEDVLADIPVDEPVVVFAAFHHDLDAIHRVALKTGRTYGELSGRSRTALSDDATMASHVQLAGVQLQSGGVGIDLTRSSVGIYYSVDFSLGNYEQSLARLDRPGQTKHGTYVHLIANKTVDERVYEALRQRKNVVEAVVEAAKNHGQGGSE